MSENQTGKKEMYLTINWQEQIAQIAGPKLDNDNRKSWLARAARRSGLPFSKIENLFYGECPDPKTSVTLRVLCAAEKYRAEASDLASQFEKLAGNLNAKSREGSHVYSEEVNGLIAMARRLRGDTGA